MKHKTISIKTVVKSMRMDGSYHNADVNVYDNLLQSHSKHNLNFYCSKIFTPGRGKRIYTSYDRGVPFLSNSDMIGQNPFMSCNYMSRKYGFDRQSLLKSGMILTGRVGAIGQTALVPKYWEDKQAMGSDNIIRIEIKPGFKNGFIYAYLVSKYGNLSFWKYATGGVQPFITDKMVGELPIPEFSDSFEMKVDDLIQESLKLRTEANILLEVAQQKFIDKIQIKTGKKNYSTVSSRQIVNSFNKRFEANFYISEGSAVEHFLITHFKCEKLGDLCYSISRPDIFKRFYVKEGIPFLGSSDIFLAIPRSTKQLSRTKTECIDSLVLEKGTILIPRSGTIGNVTIAHAGHAQKLASEHVIRLKPNDILSAEYIYAFLSTSIGKQLIQKYIFGSVIQHIESPHLSLIPIPVLPKDTIESIEKDIKEYCRKTELAIKYELDAINLIEDEIKKWKTL